MHRCYPPHAERLINGAENRATVYRFKTDSGLNAAGPKRAEGAPRRRRRRYRRAIGEGVRLKREPAADSLQWARERV